MKRIWTAVLTCTCVMVFCTSCKKDKDDKIVQTIESCVDCIECHNWSWGNGIGKPTSADGYCSVHVLEDGKLEMKYFLGPYGDSPYIDESYGTLIISGGVSFSDHLSYGRVSFNTRVAKNTTIRFSGERCIISDVRFIYDSKPTDNSDDF